MVGEPPTASELPDAPAARAAVAGDDRVWTIPNAVTVLRLLLLAPVCWAVLTGRHGSWWPVVLLGVWAATDWVDGLLARLLDQRSRLGAALDPLADRLGIIGVTLTLAAASVIEWWIVAVILGTDVVVTALAFRAAHRGHLDVSWVGKVRTAALFVAVLLLVMGKTVWAPAAPAGQALLLAGVALHLVAGAGYIAAARRVARRGAAPADPAPPARTSR